VQISSWFGDVESTFYRHPASPHPDIFRVSNDECEGCRNVGRSGWHIDGSFQERPFKIQTMHFWSVSKDGNTHFSPLRELLDDLPADMRARWDRYWFVGEQVVHPLTYSHPSTGEDTMVFHCGGAFARAIAVDYDGTSGTSSEILAPAELQTVLDEITRRLEDPARMYVHTWEVGDLAIIDNLAVGHYAAPQTQAPASTAGVRILHRTTVAGTSSPRKAGGGRQHPIEPA
jgi:alpha-ketoglutarate-dependent taurine dioxygenase